MLSESIRRSFVNHFVYGVRTGHRDRSAVRKTRVERRVTMLRTGKEFYLQKGVTGAKCWQTRRIGQSFRVKTSFYTALRLRRFKRLCPFHKLIRSPAVSALRFLEKKKRFFVFVIFSSHTITECTINVYMCVYDLQPFSRTRYVLCAHDNNTCMTTTRVRQHNALYTKHGIISYAYYRAHTSVRNTRALARALSSSRAAAAKKSRGGLETVA